MNRHDLKERKNQEEMLAYAKQEGVELSDGQLETVSGGACETATPSACYKCGANSISPAGSTGSHKLFRCNSCGLVWAPALSD